MVGYISEQPVGNISGSNISGALQIASQRTGIGFEYLMRTAMQESSLRPDAQASTSSAAGLFQFIESTWLRTLKNEGPNLGLAEAASAIETNGQGRYTVRDAELRQDILNLRHDPEVAALMAGALTRENGESLSNRLGRDPTDGELYMAHFLGADGAGRLISLSEERPGISAARAFPDAARANRSIFYQRDGRARNTADVYQLLNRKHEAAGDPAREILGDMPPVRRAAGIGSLFESLFRVFTGSGEQRFTSYFTTENLDRLAEEPVAASRPGTAVERGAHRHLVYGPPTLATATAVAHYAQHAALSDNGFAGLDRGKDDPSAIA